MKHFVSIQQTNGKFKVFEVPQEVSIYIKQLECYVSNPEKSKLKKLYPYRFKKKTKDVQDHEIPKYNVI